MLKLCAIHPNASCLTIAHLATAQLADTRESITKSSVHRLRQRKLYRISRLHLELNQPPRPQAPNRTWAMDFTNVRVDEKQHLLLGVIDHGSRKLLYLDNANKTSESLATTLSQLIIEFGKPHAIRTDNEIAFCSETIEHWFKENGIEHQRTKLHSPWQNGRIELCFGTLKRALCQIVINSTEELFQATAEFKDFYNQHRPHQNLFGRTPDMAGTGRMTFPARAAKIVTLWGGVLLSYSWGTLDAWRRPSFLQK